MPADKTHITGGAPAKRCPPEPIGRFRGGLNATVDTLATIVLWIYFTVGFILFFAPFYAWIRLTRTDVAGEYQRLNSRFYRGFFWLLHRLAPGHAWHIDPALKALQGCVVVANHASYIDPLLLISLFPKHTTIAKDRLFHIPVFGRMLALSGYIPSTAQGGLADMMIDRMTELPAFLADGGILFVFPEGTRRRSGPARRLTGSAFKIARRHRVPIAVIAMAQTERVFPPGRFRFNTRIPVTVSVRLLAEMAAEKGSLEQLTARVQSLWDGERPTGTPAVGDRCA